MRVPMRFGKIVFPGLLGFRPTLQNLLVLFHRAAVRITYSLVPVNCSHAHISRGFGNWSCPGSFFFFYNFGGGRAEANAKNAFRLEAARRSFA
jgi:hypothetical protein